MKATSTLLPEATQNGQSEWNREWEWFLRDRKWMRPASLMAHIVKACNVGDLGQSLGWEDPLEKGTATHSSILAWRIPWTEKPGRLHGVHGVTKSQTGLSNFHFQLHDCPSFLVWECLWRTLPGTAGLCTKTRAEHPGKPMSLKFSGQSNEERELHTHRTPRPAEIQP